MKSVLRKIAILYRGRIIGASVGTLIALVYIHYGFFKTLFILLCASAGYYIGMRIDGDEDLRTLIERVLPPVD